MAGGDWREIIGHDGYFLVRLRLYTVEEGGQNRHLQSGFRALWTADEIPHPMNGPVLFGEESLRSLRPGAEAIVRAHPLQPSAWIEVEPGMLLRLCKNWPRALGEGQVLERVGVPRTFVPLRRLDPPVSGAVATLRWKPTLGDRLRALLRR